MISPMSYPISEQDAAGLRSADRLTTLRRQSQSVSRSELLPGSPEALWPVLSYTDFLNQAVGMQETDNRYLNRDYGGTWMHAQTLNSGLTVAYEELPYEWSAPGQYHVERIHSKGPLKYLRFGVSLEPAESGQSAQTRVTCTIAFVSILPGPVAKLLINKEISKFMRQFQALAKALAQGTPALCAYFEPAAAQASRIEGWIRDWQDFVPELDVRSAIADYLARAPERLAYRLRPFELAAAYALDPLTVLKACLRLSREGLLHLLWDCRCPGCKGPKESFQHLSEIGSMAYCPTCAVSYGLAFDQNLELTFQPARSLRPTTDRYFCAGSPGNTPHISWQQNFSAGETRSFTLFLAPGVYAMRSLSSANELLLEVLADPVSGAGSELVVKLKDHFTTVPDFAEGLIPLHVGAKLELHNQNGYETTVMLENLYWQPNSVTAARVQAVQAFHDLFPEEVLRPGESLPLQSQILLLARIYNPAAVGDPTEILSWLESRIQLHEGAAVPHDETALLGIFATPFEALSAAWDISQELEQISLLLPEPVELGLSIARGPCEVFVREHKLAYRGPACEAAEAGAKLTLERAAGLTSGQSLAVSESLLAEPGLELFWEDPLVEISEQETADGRWRLLSFSGSFAEFLV